MKPSAQQRLGAAWRSLRNRVSIRPDTEFQQALIRVLLGALFFAYFSSPWLTHTAAIEAVMRWVGPLYVGLALLLLLGTLWKPRISHGRRLLGLGLDLGIISALLIIGAASSAPLVGMYLWVILGNGFRYGLAYLYIATLASLAGFGLVVLYNPFWQAHLPLGMGILFMLLAIPLYASSLLRQLHRAVAQEKQANQAKSQFLANMSHELRTPLNGILGVADLLGESRLDGRQKEWVQVIRASADTLLKLIEDVLDIARIEAGKHRLELGDYDLHRLVKGTLLMLEPLAQGKGLRLAGHIAPQVPYLLHGDARRLRQTLINLLGNAIKFTEGGRVDLFVHAWETGGKCWLRFEVVDTGIGIPEEAQERIFDSFTQADTSITRRYGGSGLGITICKQLVELMGGRIGCVSQVGQGSTFWFEVPTLRQAMPPATPLRLDGQEPRLGGLQVGLVTGPGLGGQLRPLILGWGGQVHQVDPIVLLSEMTANRDVPPLHAVIVEGGRLGTECKAFIQVIQDCPRGVPVILVETETDDAHPPQEWLLAGYAAVLRTPLNPVLLFNALHASTSRGDLPDNVVSLAEHFQSRRDRQLRLRVLVAEDNPVNQQVLRGLLEQAGHEVFLAHDGEEALAMLEAQTVQFDLAIVDMHMPGLSGPDLIKQWRFLEQGHLPMLMLTADATQAAQQACGEAGADAFLTKPVNSRGLLETLARVLEKRPETSSRPAGGRAPVVLDEGVLRELAELAGGLEFVRELAEGFRADAERAYAEAQVALRTQAYGQWKDQLHMLKGSAIDLGAGVLAAACAEAERLKPFELSLPLAGERLSTVRAALDAARAALQDYLARQRNAQGL